jgi:hypothetical protein
MVDITREEIMRALAEAYNHARNVEKEMDIDLIVAMADEITKVLEQHGAISPGEDGDNAGSP